MEKQKDKIKRIVNLDRFKIVIGFVSLGMILGIIGFSYALFSMQEEQRNVFTIVSGELTYTLESSELDQNRSIVVPSFKASILDLKITSENELASLYEIYYEGGEGKDIKVTYYQSESYSGIGSLNGKESTSVRVIIENNSKEEVRLVFGVQGGFLNQTLTLNQGQGLTLFQGDVLLAYHYEGEKPPKEFPKKGEGYAVSKVECSNATGTWDKNLWSLNLSSITGSGAVCTITFVDSFFPNEPELIEGLIPVTYNETTKNWVKADLSSTWYDYSNQMWANAVTVSETNRANYVSATSGTAISMEDIQTMWVWIPRYEYQYTNLGTQYAGGSASQPGEIKVNFVDVSTTTSSNASQYKIHPAFTFGFKELSGFWYGKFETSSSNPVGGTNYGGGNTTSLDPYIKPNVTSWRNINIANMFTVSKKLTQSGNIYGLSTGADSHASKNSEWGAVAYLSQSKYGKYGNSNFSGVNKEIYMNNYGETTYYTTLTGCSSGTPIASTSRTCAYTYEVPNTGTGASTTGTIYGVYDMNGGAWETVMGNLNNTLASSELSAMPESKYYDLYTTTNSATACNGGICYGHGLSETEGWYGDYQTMVSASVPWFMRGGNFNYGSPAGAFSFDNATGSARFLALSFRLVLVP